MADPGFLKGGPGAGGRKLLSTIIIELRERTGARAAALERMRFAILYAHIRARTHARARVLIASGHDVTSTYTYM